LFPLLVISHVIMM